MLCFSLFSYFSSLASYSECDCISLKANPLLIHNLNLRMNYINDFINCEYAKIKHYNASWEDAKEADAYYTYE